MEIIFEITDKTEKKIRLPKKSWGHITITHPEMANYIEEIQKTLKNPIKITHHKKGNLRNYYLYLKHRKHPA